MNIELKGKIKLQRSYFEPVFYKILPNNSKASYTWHANHYYFFFIKTDPLENLEKEAERFENYLKITYGKDEEL